MLTDEEMDDMDRRMHCQHTRWSWIGVSEHKAVKVCDDCGLDIGEPERVIRLKTTSGAYGTLPF